MTAQGGEKRECCMCGDSGLPHELLPCKSCLFRSQHRYCSNLYPRSDSYDICNWCLSVTKRVESKEKSQINTTPFCRSSGRDVISGKFNGDRMKRPERASGDKLSDKRTTRSGKRIITKGKFEELGKLRRAKSEESSKINVVKHRFKSKARRYKFLDEVSH